jgi:hypothetical protein
MDHRKEYFGINCVLENVLEALLVEVAEMEPALPSLRVLHQIVLYGVSGFCCCCDGDGNCLAKAALYAVG